MKTREKSVDVRRAKDINWEGNQFEWEGNEID
jgi:hypothetical protein